MTLRPVTMKEVVGGQPYIEIEVWRDGTMSLSHHTLYGRPIRRDGVWWFRMRKNESRASTHMDELTNFCSAADAGLNPERRYNVHRTFRYTERNRRALSDLVKCQALGEYLDLIEATDQERSFLSRTQSTPFEPFIDEWDDYNLDPQEESHIDG